MNIDIKEFLGSNLFLGVPNFEKEKLWHPPPHKICKLLLRSELLGSKKYCR